MTYQIIDIGTSPNSGDGDALRTAFTKINENFSILWGAVNPGGDPENYIAGAVQFRDSYSLLDSSNDNTTGTVGIVSAPNRLLVKKVGDISWRTADTLSQYRAIAFNAGVWVVVGDGGSIASGTDLESLTNRSSGTINDLKSVHYGNGFWLAVGENGTILRSPDSITWTTVTTGFTHNLNALVYNTQHNIWITVGDGGVLYVGDGINWVTQWSSTTNDLHGIAFYLNTVISVGDNGTIITSQDLVNWISRTSGTTKKLNSVSVFTLNSTITAIAVGNDGVITRSITPGFITWDSAAVPSVNALDLNSIKSEVSGFRSVGDFGTMWTSTGGSVTTDHIPVELRESDRLLFQLENNRLLVDADIIPKANNTWSIGSVTNKWKDAHISNAVIIDDVVIHSPAVGNLQIDGNLLLDEITANIGYFDELNVNVLNAPSLSFTTLNVDTLTTEDITSNTITANTITAEDGEFENLISNNITANTGVFDVLFGDGGNLTGLPVQSIVAGTNISVSNVGGTWTISSTSTGGGGGGGTGTTNNSSGSLGSIQLSNGTGGFNHSANLSYTGNTLMVAGSTVVARRFEGNVLGGNISGSHGTFTGNLSTGNLTVSGQFNVGSMVMNTANLGNVRIFSSNVQEFGVTGDPFVINSLNSNVIIHGANSSVSNQNARTVNIIGGNVMGIANAGPINIRGGTGGALGNGGVVTISGGVGGVQGTGGNVRIFGGNSGGGATGGSIIIKSGETIGDPTTTDGSSIFIEVGHSYNEDAGNLWILGGNATGGLVHGGNVFIKGGSGTLTHGRVNISGGGAGATVASFTNEGLEIGSVRADHFILGNSTFTASDSWWVDSQTSTNAPAQVIYQYPAAGINSLDFKIIAYDTPASNKQSSMITTVTYGATTAYSSYATTSIGGLIAGFAVDQVGGMIRLLASPNVNYLVKYTIIVTKF
jgi:hypothetical protein